MSCWENYEKLQKTAEKKVFQEEGSDLLYPVLLMGQVTWELTTEVTMEATDDLGENELGAVVKAEVRHEWVQEQMVGVRADAYRPGPPTGWPLATGGCRTLEMWLVRIKCNTDTGFQRQYEKGYKISQKIFVLITC